VCEGLTPKFLSTKQVQEIHAQVILSWTYCDHCDVELLDSAVHAVENYAIYGEPDDVFDLGAAYAFYISGNHPFTDGNKRTAFVACMTFLKINGVETEQYEDIELFDWMIDLVTKKLDREGLAERLRARFSE
jgi:death on curing protein